MKKISALLLSFLFITSLIAQEGAPLLTHFKESREIENQNWAICQDVNNVMLFANRKGVLTFDGEDWISVRIPIIPYCMQADPADGRIYTGGDNSFGLLEKDGMGLYNYRSLSGDNKGLGVITKIIFNDSVAWFYGEESVNRLSLKTGKTDLYIKAKGENTFRGMVITPKNTFINVLNKGLQRLESDTLFPIVTGFITEKTDILFSLPYNSKMALVGFGDGKLSLFDGVKYFDYQIKDDGYLRDNVLSEGISIGDSLYAFSTLDGGALVVDKTSGKIRFTINNQNELPDDEIFAIGTDRSGGLWLSHQYGLTRADLTLPVGNFSIYPGLKGNLTTSLRYNNELYVASSEGVYYLTEVKNYAEVQVLVKNEGPVSDASKNTGKSKDKQAPRKNIFQKIFGKKLAQEKVSASGTQQKTQVGQFSSKTVSKLKSTNYIFKKVEGLNEKCRQLVSTRNGILAATNKGLYLISSHRANVVAENRYINFISWQPVEEKYFIAAMDGCFSVKYQVGKWKSESLGPEYSDPVYSVLETKDKTLWLGVDNAALMFKAGRQSESEPFTSVSIKNDYPQRYFLNLVNDSVYLLTESGIFFFDPKTGGMEQIIKGKNLSASRTNYSLPLSNMPWVKHGEEWIFLGSNDNLVRKEISILRIFNDIISISADKGMLWVVDGENRLFRIDLNKPSKINPEINVLIKSVYNESGTTFNLSDIVFKRGDKIVNFDIIVPGYLKQNTTQYQYTISKLMPNWSPWSARTSYNLMVPVAGEYTLKVRAKDIWGNISEPQLVKFTIKAPFTETTFFYILVGSVVLFLIFIFVRFREKQLQKENKILEQKVKERTAEIEAQKEEITSSIEYASRIQRAMLPEKEHFIRSFDDHFVIFKPRDIVSGDFYWIGEDEKHIFFTVADCTGHGVPGAFMSSLGISTLNEIITNHEDLQANKVLSLLRDKIKTSLHQTGKVGEAADGMDVAFCMLHKNKKSLEYSGAYNPLIIFQNGELKEYKADRMPIGIYYGEKHAFTNYEISIKKGDTLYLFSDGLADQFGGPEGVKYKLSNLKKLLTQIHTKPMAEQQAIIEEEFSNWKGAADQVDDITLIGIRI